MVISMVVIGGLGSIPGAVLGALYLEGLPAIFGANPTIQFLTSGIGLIAFILYLPGGLAEVMHRLGDVVTVGVRSAQQRCSGAGPDSPAPDVHLSEPVAPPSGGRPANPALVAAGGTVIAAGRRPPPRWSRSGPTGPARLEVEHLGVTFGGVRAVDDVSFTAEPGVHRRPHRRQRVGQDDHAGHDLGPGRPPARARCVSTATTWASTCPRNASASGWSAPSRTAGSTPSCRCTTS